MCYLEFLREDEPITCAGFDKGSRRPIYRYVDYLFFLMYLLYDAYFLANRISPEMEHIEQNLKVNRH